MRAIRERVAEKGTVGTNNAFEEPISVLPEPDAVNVAADLLKPQFALRHWIDTAERASISPRA